MLNCDPNLYVYADARRIEQVIVNLLSNAIVVMANFLDSFITPKMKGEKGEVTFYFKNEKGNQLEWKKELTLQ